MTNVIIYSDFEFDRFGHPMTGYSNIASSLGTELMRRKIKVIGMGCSYRRNQHHLPFHISQIPVPLSASAINAIVTNLTEGIDAVICALDINIQSRICEVVKKDKTKFIGIYAVEGDPLLFSWAKDLMKFNKRYAISQFGVDEAAKMYVKSKHFVVPINEKIWIRRTEEEKNTIKQSIGLPDKKIIFCNADSNERKNLSALLEGIKLAVEKDNKIHLVLLTRKESPVGWKYDELIAEFQIQNSVTVIDRGGIEIEKIRSLYAGSDLYIQPSKAEGCCLPVLEAMSVGVPVLATNCTALSEHIKDGKGIPLESGFIHRDVFGNSKRYYVYPQEICDKILANIDNDNSDIVEKASNYIEERKNLFSKTIDSIEEDINGQQK